MKNSKKKEKEIPNEIYFFKRSSAFFKTPGTFLTDWLLKVQIFWEGRIFCKKKSICTWKTAKRKKGNFKCNFILQKKFCFLQKILFETFLKRLILIFSLCQLSQNMTTNCSLGCTSYLHKLTSNWREIDHSENFNKFSASNFNKTNERIHLCISSKYPVKHIYSISTEFFLILFKVI